MLFLLYPILHPLLLLLAIFALLFSCTMRLRFISIRRFERLFIKLQVNLSPNQFLKVIFDCGQLGLHILEEDFTIGMILDITRRCWPPIYFIGNKERLLIEGIPLLREWIDIGTLSVNS